MKNNSSAGKYTDQKLIRKYDLQSHRKNLVRIRQEVEDAASDCGFSDNDIYQMKVAVSEAAANAIEHGSPHGAENFIHLSIECDSDKISIEIADEGVFKARLPVTDGRPSHRGRGIFLMTALMDQMSIVEQQEGTVVKLVKLKDSSKTQNLEEVGSLL